MYILYYTQYIEGQRRYNWRREENSWWVYLTRNAIQPTLVENYFQPRYSATNHFSRVNGCTQAFHTIGYAYLKFLIPRINRGWKNYSFVRGTADNVIEQSLIPTAKRISWVIYFFSIASPFCETVFLRTKVLRDREHLWIPCAIVNWSMKRRRISPWFVSTP